MTKNKDEKKQPKETEELLSFPELQTKLKIPQYTMIAYISHKNQLNDYNKNPNTPIMTLNDFKEDIKKFRKIKIKLR